MEIYGHSIESWIQLAARNLLIAQYGLTSAYCLVVYDWMLSLEDEIELVLFSPWSLMKVAYLFSRYYPLLVYPMYMWAWLGKHSNDMCKDIAKPLYALLIVFQMSSQAVFVLRTYAFTGRTSTILVILTSTYFILSVGGAIVFAVYFEWPPELSFLLGDTGCFADMNHIPGTPWGDGRPMGLLMIGYFCFDALMLGLLLRQCFRRGIQGNLGKLFLTQGIVVFVTMSFLNLFTAVLYFTNLRQWHGVGLQINLVFSNVLACRIILSIRRFASPTESELSRFHSQVVRDALEHVPSFASPEEGPGPPPPARTSNIREGP